MNQPKKFTPGIVAGSSGSFRATGTTLRLLTRSTFYKEQFQIQWNFSLPNCDPITGWIADSVVKQISHSDQIELKTDLQTNNKVSASASMPNCQMMVMNADSYNSNPAFWVYSKILPYRFRVERNRNTQKLTKSVVLKIVYYV
jgi:hypothetical protein